MVSRIIAGLGCLWAMMATAASLDAGVARCAITPDVVAYRVPMAGYGARLGRPSKGVHDALYAKVLYLRDGGKALAVITTDLRSVTQDFKTQVVEKAGAEFTLDNVFMCASHTHSGPSMYAERFWQMQFGKYDPAIVDAMSTAVARALREAVQNAAPARIGFGEGRVEGFTHNRRWEYDTAARETAKEQPAVNPVLRVMRVDGADGVCRAVLTCFASHPTLLGADNMLLSAERPGVLQREIEAAFPGAVAMFCNGAEGDQAPAGAQGADAFARVEDYGKRLAREAERIAHDVKTRADLPVGIIRVTPTLPEITFSAAAEKGPYRLLAAQGRTDLPRQAEIQVVRIGDAALVGLPGEPLCAVGLETEQRVKAAGFKDVLFLGLANDYLGYLVNEQEYAHGGYEVNERSFYGPGLGTFLATQAGEAAAKLF